MAASAVGYVVADWFAASAAAEVIGGAVAVGLADAGVAAGLALTASSVVVSGAGLVLGQIAGSLVTSAFGGGGGGGANTAIGQSGGGSVAGGGTPSSVSAAQAQGLLINVTSNVEQIPVIYGSRKVGGPMAFIELSPSTTEYLNLIVVVSEGDAICPGLPA